VLTEQPDDFVIVRVDGASRTDRRAGAFAIVGPGLEPEGIPFASLEDAITRGRQIARTSGVSLWQRADDGTLVFVVSFRR